MRLDISKSKLNLYIRRIVFVLLIILVAKIQNTPHLFPTVFGAHALLLIPVVVCISMFERDLASTLMGVLAGGLWDVVSVRGDGFNAIYLMITATAVGLLINYLMRNNLSTAMLLSVAAVLLYVILHWLFFVVFRGVPGGTWLLFTFYLPSVIYTLIFVPLIYIIMRSFLKRLKERYPHKSRVRRP